ncbi:MAG: SDR family NAD(P)-dependent oxidoreductase, partial [Spirochaetes bacterium]|nr:SDR family NAD(P)-dependent oxidoreductase [Spirochaetota bacterium]
MLKKNVIITGVSRKCGIGAAIAIRLASIGYNIFITYFRKYDNDMPGWKKDDTEVYAIIKEVKKYPIKFGSLELDLSIADNLPVLFDNAENKLGPIYGIINNAAFSIDPDINTISAEL